MSSARWRELMLGWLFGEGPDGAGSSAGLPKGPQMSLLSISDDFLALHNAGKETAKNVLVDPVRSSIAILNPVDEPFDIRPGESWTFLIEDLGPWTEVGWQVTVTWDGQDEPVCVPLPARTV